MKKTALSFIIAFGLGLQGCATPTRNRYTGTPYRPPCTSRSSGAGFGSAANFGGFGAEGLALLIVIAAFVSVIATISSSGSDSYSEDQCS
ncbi:MAG: hypothetical protein AAB250_03095 [Bdellovibrionota bacterium]